MRKLFIFLLPILMFSSCDFTEKISEVKDKISESVRQSKEPGIKPTVKPPVYENKKKEEKNTAEKQPSTLPAVNKDEDDGEYSIAYINDYAGDCELKRKGEEIGEAVSDIYLPLYEGDTVITEEGSSMEVVFDDATIIKLDPDSKLVIRGLTRETGSVSTVIELVKGRIFGVVKKLMQKEEFTVKTKLAMAAVKGTELVVETGDEDKIGVYDGKVVVTSYDMDGNERGSVVLDKEKETIITKRLRGPEKPKRLSRNFVKNYKKIKDARQKIEYMRELRRSGRSREFKLERRLERIENLKTMMRSNPKYRNLSPKQEKLMNEIIKQEEFYRAQLDREKKKERRTKKRIEKYLDNKKEKKGNENKEE